MIATNSNKEQQTTTTRDGRHCTARLGSTITAQRTPTTTTATATGKTDQPSSPSPDAASSFLLTFSSLGDSAPRLSQGGREADDRGDIDIDISIIFREATSFSRWGRARGSLGGLSLPSRYTTREERRDRREHSGSGPLPSSPSVLCPLRPKLQPRPPKRLLARNAPFFFLLPFNYPNDDKKPQSGHASTSLLLLPPSLTLRLFSGAQARVGE